MNLGPMDRDVRFAIIAPIALLEAVGFGVTPLGVAALGLGIAMAVTALLGYDPTYELFRSRTRTTS